ncbi:MAG: AsmA family protein, partial [Alphaproteobacteria bacterium]|nr:AsmA family protein [Alphaproteobacteria bacterium]
MRKVSLKRLLEYFAIAVAAFAAFALLVRTVDANKYKPQLSQMLYAVLGREVRQNGPVDFSAGFDGIRISARDVAVVNKGPASRPLLAGIGRVELGMDTLCLFKGYLPIKELSIENADILFETNAEGKSNWILGEAEGVSREREFLSVDLLKIVNSRIVRLKAGGAHTNAEIETLTLKMDGSSVNLNAKGRLNRAPFIADIRTNKKDLFGRDPFSIDAAGIYDGLNFAAIGTVDLAGGRAEFQAYEAAVGETRFGGALDATWRSGRLILHGNVASKRFNSANFKVRIVNEAGQRPVVEPGVDPNALIFSANPLPLDKLRAADVDLAISIDELPLGLNVLTGIEARLILSRGYLTLAPVKAYLGRAPVELRMVLDATAPVARFDFGLIADGVELGDVQNLWGMKAFLTGNGGVYVRLAGKGNSAHEIASNLIGIVNVG